MNQVIRETTFRGSIVSHLVSLTKNEYPQLVAELIATEIWDSEEKIWVDFTSPEYVEEGNGAVAYLVLFGAKGETLNCTQVKKVTKWDGLSFQGLNDMDLSEVGIQFRMENNTYKDKTTLQVAWIDEYDAVPGGISARKLNPDELKQLDVKYKQFMARSAPAQAPAKPATDKPTSPGKVIAKGKKATQARGPVKKTTAPAMPEPSADPDLPVGAISRKEAWETCVEMRTDKISDDKLAKTWNDSILSVSGGNDPTKLTNEQWFLVRNEVLDVVAKF